MQEKSKMPLVITVIFCVFLLAGLVWNLLTPDREFSPMENRMLEQRPVFSWQALFDGSYTSDAETWLTDQFAGRDWWVGLKYYCERALLKTAQEIYDVLLANDVPSCLLNQYKDRYHGEYLEQSLANGYMIEHTYDSGNKVYLTQMPIYFESQGTHHEYERCHAIGEDNEALLKEFGE